MVRRREQPGKGIGAANDYYRLRLMRMDDVDAPEFEWREDILWRQAPSGPPAAGRQVCRVEAVSLDDPEAVVLLGTFDCDADAFEALASADEEMAELTRSEFEERYFPADA